MTAATGDAVGDIVTTEITDPWLGYLAEPVRGGGDEGGDGDDREAAGVLILAGASGAIAEDRCRLLAEEGLTALSIRWRGGPGQAAGICEIPLETFTAAIDLLEEKGLRRFGVLAFSKGTEAAMLLAVRDPRVGGVVAISPTSVVWANNGPGLDGEARPYRSCWIWQGVPLPFTPYDDEWRVPDDQASLSFFEHSMETFAEQAREAAVPIEETAARVLLVAGADDRIWPSLPFAQDLLARGLAAGRRISLISSPEAGHRVTLPGMETPESGRFRYGGTAEADAALGAEAWPHVLDVLRGTAD